MLFTQDEQLVIQPKAFICLLLQLKKNLLVLSISSHLG